MVRRLITPPHQPLLVCLQGTGDGLGVRWRPGDAHTAHGAEAWITTLVRRLQAVGVQDITMRLDKGFFSEPRLLPDLRVENWPKIHRCRGEGIGVRSRSGSPP